MFNSWQNQGECGAPSRRDCASQVNRGCASGEQCPLEAGPLPVAMARGMARLAGIIITPNECGEKMEGERRSENKRDIPNENLVGLVKPNISVLPNPVLNMMYIDFEFEEEKERVIYLHDVLGRRVGVYPLGILKGRRSIDVSNMESGIYWVSIFSEGQPIYSQKVVFQTK